MRTVNGTIHKNRRKKVLNRASGFMGGRHRLYRTAKDAIKKSGQFAYRDRRQRKRQFRALWITRINAAAREHGMSYSTLIGGLSKAGVELDRKSLSEIAIHSPEGFKKLAEVAKG